MHGMPSQPSPGVRRCNTRIHIFLWNRVYLFPVGFSRLPFTLVIIEATIFAVSSSGSLRGSISLLSIEKADYLCAFIFLKTPFGGIHMHEVRRLFAEGQLHPTMLLLCPHSAIQNLPQPRIHPPAGSVGVGASAMLVGQVVQGARLAEAHGRQLTAASAGGPPFGSMTGLAHAGAPDLSVGFTPSFFLLLVILPSSVTSLIILFMHAVQTSPFGGRTS